MTKAGVIFRSPALVTLLAWTLFPDSYRHQEEQPMDDYQEEILDFHASEQDSVEPAEDATEM
jgi:hypothetical protein